MDAVFDAFITGVAGPIVDGRKDVSEEPVSVPGRHNRANAFLALRMALALGCEESAARKALLSFGGVERRLQKYGTRVYDDYAHNPEKLHAMWTTLTEEFAGGGICVIWRPHGYAPLRKMKEALAAMFNAVIRPQDKLLLLPVYDAGGTTDRSLNSGALAALLKVGSCVEVADLEAAYKWCLEHAADYAAFATCGARDPNLPSLAARLAAKLR